MSDAASEAALVPELEPHPNAGRQRALPPADDDRNQEQMAVVDQAGGERRAGELGTADRDVARR